MENTLSLSQAARRTELFPVAQEVEFLCHFLRLSANKFEVILSKNNLIETHAHLNLASLNHSAFENNEKNI